MYLFTDPDEYQIDVYLTRKFMITRQMTNCKKKIIQEVSPVESIYVELRTLTQIAGEMSRFEKNIIQRLTSLYNVSAQFIPT